MSTLEYTDVTVRYGRRVAVEGVDLVVPSGKVHGLVGESGSGKSTLAAASVGLSVPTAGSIRLSGVDIVGPATAARHARRRIQLIFQDPFSALDPRMPIGASVAEATRATNRRWTRKDRTKRVAELLSLVHIDPTRARELPAAFSGGQRQRITIARALAAEPDVIVADEITSALDVSVQGLILNLLRELQAELNLTVLFISHNLAVVRYVSDTVSVMRAGRIVETGATEQVLTAPSDPYTQELLSAIPIMGEPFTWHEAVPH